MTVRKTRTHANFIFHNYKTDGAIPIIIIQYNINIVSFIVENGNLLCTYVFNNPSPITKLYVE